MNFNQKTTRPLITLCMTGFLCRRPSEYKAHWRKSWSAPWKSRMNGKPARQDEPVVLRLSDMSPSFRVRSATVWDGTNGNPFPVG